MPGENLVFGVQAGFSFSTLLFCIIMLGADKDPTYYLPILTSIIGYWLPAPQYRNVPADPAGPGQGQGRAQGARGLQRFPTLHNLHNVFLRKQAPSLPAPPDTPSIPGDDETLSECEVERQPDNSPTATNSPADPDPGQENADAPEESQVVVVVDK